ncbi:MAG: hypothetical protein ACYTDY_16710 [Planctomycetota bacterium]|jgi:hypothetical protein
MKKCASCGAELADYAEECIYCGQTFEKEEAETPAEESEGVEAPAEESEGPEIPSSESAPEEGEPAAGEEPPLFDEPPALDDAEPQTKNCIFCGSEIAIGALRCPHCAGFLPIAEGVIFKQYFFFLFACICMAVGCLLPWERSHLNSLGLPGYDLTGAESIGGAFVLVFAIYGAIASVWNIYHRRMIVWPVILAAIDGAIVGWTRVVQISKATTIEITAIEEFGKMVQRVKGYIAAYGPGLYLVTIFSTLVILSVVLSVFKGAKEDARRKQEERETRAAARKTRRT